MTFPSQLIIDFFINYQSSRSWSMNTIRYVHVHYYDLSSNAAASNLFCSKFNCLFRAYWMVIYFIVVSMAQKTTMKSLSVPDFRHGSLPKKKAEWFNIPFSMHYIALLGLKKDVLLFFLISNSYLSQFTSGWPRVEQNISTRFSGAIWYTCQIRDF